MVGEPEKDSLGSRFASGEKEIGLQPYTRAKDHMLAVEVLTLLA